MVFKDCALFIVNNTSFFREKKLHILLKICFDTDPTWIATSEIFSPLCFVNPTDPVTK